MRLLSIAIMLSAVVVLGVAGAAEAKPKPQSTFQAAPGFPDSTLAIDVQGRPRAGGIVRLLVSGFNAPRESTEGSGSFIPYSLDVFVQNPKALSTCPVSFDDELNNDINLIAVSRVLMGSNEGDFGEFEIPVLFESNRKIRNIVACAYSRWIIDDVAVSRLKFKLRKPKKR